MQHSSQGGSRYDCERTGDLSLARDQLAHVQKLYCASLTRTSAASSQWLFFPLGFIHIAPRDPIAVVTTRCAFQRSVMGEAGSSIPARAGTPYRVPAVRLLSYLPDEMPRRDYSALRHSLV